ncbi:hypothetical protein [Paenibacillus koleovorans]|uniref:hypothetical protein n=1 Tax=Paenibacillus koleovorans TaxID=121608 RepID=UPI000FD6E1D0|nr:hypothetical protein [Paenibacillus koleovorans]
MTGQRNLAVFPDDFQYAYHYFEASEGPFRSLTELPEKDAESVLRRLRERGKSFASQRAADYLTIRRELEQRVRGEFQAKGGRPVTRVPVSMTLGPCPWIQSWYESGQFVRIPLSDLQPSAISFTYGDLFPTMRLQDGKPYRAQVYTLAELPALIEKFGFPQVWNAAGAAGPERYIEIQVWHSGFLCES